MNTHVEARLTGGPGNGQVWALDGIKDRLQVKLHPDNPEDFKFVEYVPIGISITYAPKRG